jgi:soluble lytic murein transglycosylase-like protein
MKEIIEKISAAHGVDSTLVIAIIHVESSLKSKTCRYEPGYQWLVDVDFWAKKQGFSSATEEALQKFSWGPMHIMGATARDHGFDGFIPDLCQPELGIEFGVRHLKSQLKRYKGNVLEAISSYNAGREMCDLTGCEDEKYVMKVVNWMRKK